MKKILVLSDSIPYRSSIQDLLPAHTCNVCCTNRVEFAYELLGLQEFDIVIIHLQSNFQFLDVIDVAQDVAFTAKTFVVSECLTSNIKLEAFKRGADEYLLMPYSSKEFILRFERLLLYQKARMVEGIQYGRLQLLPHEGLVLADDERIPLRKREFQILFCLLKHKKMVVSREMMIDLLWQGDIPLYSTIDSYVRRLRVLVSTKYLEIKTVRGFGYMAIPKEM